MDATSKKDRFTADAKECRARAKELRKKADWWNGTNDKFEADFRRQADIFEKMARDYDGMAAAIEVAA